MVERTAVHSLHTSHLYSVQLTHNATAFPLYITNNTCSNTFCALWTFFELTQLGHCYPSQSYEAGGGGGGVNRGL